MSYHYNSELQGSAIRESQLAPKIAYKIVRLTDFTLSEIF